MAHFTKENARAYAAKAAEAKRKLADELKRFPDLPSLNQDNARARSIRLWAILNRIDARIEHELNRGRLEVASKLGNLGKIIRGQIDADSNPRNGKAAPLPAPPLPDLP